MKTITQAFALMSLSAAAMAATPSAKDIQRCAALADSTARLACFDQLSGAKKAPAAAPAPAVAPVAAAPAAAAAPVAPAAAPTTASLGEEMLAKTRTEKAAAAPTSLTANVTGVVATQGNMFRITLDNGQVWQTQEGRSVFTVRPGDTVHIDKRSMGSYQLARFVDGKAGYPVRATRQK
ncbi:MAG: hypothetical protein ABI616_11175 [Pseudomonadota bacterium]